MSNYSFQELTATKPIEAYTKEQIKNIKLLSTNKKELAVPFGSATYRIQKYPGDLDLHTIFTECCSLDDVVKTFEKKIKKIAKDIKKNRLHYFSEFKAGLDKRFDLDIGTIYNGLFNPKRSDILDYSNILFKKKLIAKDELKLIQKIVSIPNPGGDEYDMLKYIFREHTVLRWTLDEVINGVKILPGNVKMKLYDALKMRSHVKIDMITLVNNLIVEVTNFFILVEENEDGSYSVINIDYDYLDKKQSEIHYDIQIKEEIEKLYYSDMYYSPFKMAKRMWAYSRAFGFEDSVRKLLPLVTGNVSYLYQLKSEMDTILRLYELNKAPNKTIDKQMDLMKQKLSNIIFIPKEELLIIYSLINKFLKTANVKNKEDILTQIKKYFVALINLHTIHELNKIGYNPPPRKFLPYQLKYASIVRQPHDIVINPFKKIVSGSGIGVFYKYKTMPDQLSYPIIPENNNTHRIKIMSHNFYGIANMV